VTIATPANIDSVRIRYTMPHCPREGISGGRVVSPPVPEEESQFRILGVRVGDDLAADACQSWHIWGQSVKLS